MTTRRDFLRTSAAASGVLIAGGTPALANAAERAIAWRSQTAAPLNILILGGTGFIGPHIVNAALARGHKVSTFTRGRRDGSMLPSSVEQLVGDRAVSDSLPKGNLRSITGRKWDVVFDDSASAAATAPTWVRNTTELLKDAGAYMFVSSTGVFLPYLTPNNAETDPVILVQPNPARPEYGVAKAQCEQIVMQAFGTRGYVVRPGYIVGPGDTTNRFPYWPQRIARGGEILAPGRKTDPSQLIDVRDLTEFMVKLVEDKNSGIYNVGGPAEKIGFGTFMEEAVAALNPSAQLTWCDSYDFLRWQRIAYAVPWMIPEGDNKHHMDINNKKAVAAGLKCRSIATTVRDTYEWWKTVPEVRKNQAETGPQGAFAISRAVEARALAAWKSGNPPPRAGRGG